MRYLTTSYTDWSKPVGHLGIVIPIFNAGHIIEEVIIALSVVDQDFTLLLILDACEDDSKDKALQGIDRLLAESKHCNGFYLFESQRNLYEAQCDNFGFKFFEHFSYILELQADIVITDDSFVKRAVSALEMFPDIFCVSGRGTHAWELPLKPKNPIHVLTSRWRIQNTGNTQIQDNFEGNFHLEAKEFIQDSYFGQTGALVSGTLIHSEDSLSNIYLGETVMRGPLVFNNDHLKRCGYLNSRAHRLGNDDHELTLRAWRNFAYRVAYVPCSFISRLEWGATRRKKSAVNHLRYTLMRTYEYFNFRRSSLMEASRDMDFSRPKYEIRKLL